MKEDWLSRLVALLDDGYRIPGTKIYFGWDSLLGFLLPVVGDWLGALVSLVLVGVAIKKKLPWRIVARMLANIIFDAVLGMLPLIGDYFDLLFKTNRRNLKLLRGHLDNDASA
ncbi:MAG: DUF4112 domain-containing protein [Myxococcales bacterium]|nr:MAG: DUF4112 domain-containing protein [Myxococcales bacterium]